METLLELKQLEGLTYDQLSEQSGVPASTLAAWKRKLNREREPRATEFVELKVSEHNSLELRLPTGVSIAIRPGFDAHLLRQVVEALAC